MGSPSWTEKALLDSHSQCCSMAWFSHVQFSDQSKVSLNLSDASFYNVMSVFVPSKVSFAVIS